MFSKAWPKPRLISSREAFQLLVYSIFALSVACTLNGGSILILIYSSESSSKHGSD